MRGMKKRTGLLVWMICLAISPLALSADISYEFPPGKQGSSPQQPQVAVAPDGSIYLVYGSDTTIYCAFSRDGGKAFSMPVVVASEGPMALGGHRGPRIATTKDYVVI